MAKDYLGNKLSVGDKVVFITGSYRDFNTGVIENITDKMLEVSYGKRGHTTKRYHGCVVLILG